MRAEKEYTDFCLSQLVSSSHVVTRGGIDDKSAIYVHVASLVPYRGED